MPFIQNNENDIKEMLEKIGVEKFEDLLDSIPEEFRTGNKFNIGKALSEPEVWKHLYNTATKNKNSDDNISFLGGGIYDHYVPAAVDQIASRSEFYTAYTPYQAEVSQGTLIMMYEYQTLINRLTGMEVTNDSMYDGATAMAEAAHMARVINGKHNIVISETVNPLYIEVVKTYSHGLNIPIRIAPSKDGKTDIDAIVSLIDNETAAVIAQNPNFFGIIENMEKLSETVHEKDTLFIAAYDPISLAILKTPGEYNADIAVGEGQALGNPQSFGGPLLGLFSTKRKFIRQVPGRIVGATKDANGNTGYVMTLQTREQHIKRDRATSNICTNEGLCMTRAAIYLELLGEEGLKTAAETSTKNSHYLFDKLLSVNGIEAAFPNTPFFKEFVIKLPIEAKTIINKLENRGIFAGINLGKFRKEWAKMLLIAVTETKTKDEMDYFVSEIKKII